MENIENLNLEKKIGLTKKLSVLKEHFFKNISQHVDFLFNYQYNPFLANISSKTKLSYLLEQVKYMFIALEVNKNNKNAKDNLYFLLTCLYAAEISHEKKFFVCNPPFIGLSKSILNHRLEYLPDYRRIMDFYFKKIRKKLSLSDSFNFKQLKNLKIATSRDADSLLFLDDQTRKDLMNIKKVPVTKEFQHFKHVSNTQHKRLLLGEYKGEKYLFLEEYSLNNYQRFLEKTSYQLAIITDVNKFEKSLIYRMDYLPTANHINKLDKDKTLFCIDPSISREDLRMKEVRSCHIHIPTEKYSLVFPCYQHSCDATALDLQFNNINDFIKANQKYNNIEMNMEQNIENVDNQDEKFVEGGLVL